MCEQIREINENDEEELINLWLAFIQDEDGADLNIVPFRENAEKWLDFVRKIVYNKKGNLLVAIKNGKIVCYIFYSWNSSPLKTKITRGTIYDLYVIPEFRGMGIGKELMRNALNEMSHRGAEMIQVTVMSKNNAAIHLYEEFGFRKVMKTMRLSFKEM